MRIRFWGATDDVTGSMTFLVLESGNVMIDCGLAQGLPQTEKINAIPLPVLPSSITDVIITHAHLDHSGYLPHLVKKGFRGKIHCTPATAQLMRIILMDSAKLNEDGFYAEEDVLLTLSQVKTHDWEHKFDVHGLEVKFFPAAHILGASSVLLTCEGKRIIFSGDLGRHDDPILPPLTGAPQADIIVMESTYGGKSRKGNLEQDLAQFLTTVARESRVGIIASFAVARAQMLLTLIHQFHLRHPEEKVRLVMDSPMMKEANKIYQRFSHLTKIPVEVFESLEDIDAIDFQKEWNSLKKKTGPLIILSSSGMVTGGRIGRHLENWHEDKKAILYLPGYQGAGTPGRSLIEGKRSLIGPQGNRFEWQGEVWSSEAFSSHADQNELRDWLGSENKQAQVFLIHGEEASKEAFKGKLEGEQFSKVVIPKRGSLFHV